MVHWTVCLWSCLELDLLLWGWSLLSWLLAKAFISSIEIPLYILGNINGPAFCTSLFIHEAALSKEAWFIKHEERESSFYIIQKNENSVVGGKKKDIILIYVLDNWSFLSMKDTIEVIWIFIHFSHPTCWSFRLYTFFIINVLYMNTHLLYFGELALYQFFLFFNFNRDMLTFWSFTQNVLDITIKT